MRKIIILSFLFLFLFSCLLIGNYYYKIDNEPDNDCLLVVNNETYEYYDEVNYKDIVDSSCNLISNDFIDTYSLGEKSIEINYINKKNKQRSITFNYKVVDTTSPILLLSSSYSSYLGEEPNFANMGICADNYDNEPNCYVRGYFDINKVGTYNMTYYAVDSSNNTTSKEFKLKIKKKTNSKSETTTKKKPIEIKHVISKYKNDDTMIGMDVSAWQDDIDYNKAKDAGIEFVIIRIGYGHKDNKIIMDKWYLENIRKAKEANLLVGLYFYSYATSTSLSKEQANWIIDTLNGEEIDLPIAFDFESFSKFNSYKISLTTLNQTAKVFMDTLEENGYKGMLYGSKYYLENMWNLDKYPTWLAHYTSETNYDKDYYIWQFTSRGSVPGISGNVDLDVLYMLK